jgi:hypothetical protein
MIGGEMTGKRRSNEEAAHDVLAAEEFVVPAPDPALHRDPAHDVLAAEEFGVPAGDPSLRHGPVTLPSDPTGIAEPHDVLAAEEFAMPAPPPGSHEASPATRSRRRPAALIAAGALAALVALRARKRRR